MHPDAQFDVAIVGGGPAGSTTGSLLRKYNGALRVAILEKARFPREHVGESQLPAIGSILSEMGAWEAVEAAGFPIKVGASYTWGRTTEPWEFEFLPLSAVQRNARPEPHAGWRTRTALQVDRALYDDILLRHAAQAGCTVQQDCEVTRVHTTGDRIDALETAGGSTVRAAYYVDASGNAAILRRALGVEIDAPTALQNVAFWNYWDDARVLEDRFGHGVTRVQIRSLPNGWIWYIPLSLSRVSVGFVCPAGYYKRRGLRPAQIYEEALGRESGISALLRDATPDGNVRAITDWSFLSRRAAGENWLLCGESLGFADPILAAGLTLTHACGRHCAYTLLELLRGGHPRAWLLEQYEDLQRRRVRQHMRFAEYWYSANGCFGDLQDYCKEIAAEAGLTLSSAEAFQWLSTGGFEDVIGQAIIGGFSLAGVKQAQYRLSGGEQSGEYLISGKNRFALNLDGASRRLAPNLTGGAIRTVPMYEREGRRLVVTGCYELVVLALSRHSDANEILPFMRQVLIQSVPADNVGFAMGQTIQAMEAMANDGWIVCRAEPGRPTLEVSVPEEGDLIYTSRLRRDHSAGIR
jgi:flavin-dependent dehydrogenase